MSHNVLIIRNAEGKEYHLEDSDKINEIEISDGTGEGGYFDENEFWKVIDKFYKEWF